MAEADLRAGGKTGIVTIYRSFDECVAEIRELETHLRPIPPHIPKGGIGPAIEQFSRSYGEALAELRRLSLINAMCVRKGIK